MVTLRYSANGPAEHTSRNVIQWQISLKMSYYPVCTGRNSSPCLFKSLMILPTPKWQSAKLRRGWVSLRGRLLTSTPNLGETSRTLALYQDIFTTLVSCPDKHVLQSANANLVREREIRVTTAENDIHHFAHGSKPARMGSFRISWDTIKCAANPQQH